MFHKIKSWMTLIEFYVFRDISTTTLQFHCRYIFPVLILYYCVLTVISHIKDVCAHVSPF